MERSRRAVLGSAAAVGAGLLWMMLGGNDDGQANNSGDSPDSTAPSPAGGPPTEQVKTIHGSELAEHLGRSVGMSTSGTQAVVGAPGYEQDNEVPGGVYVYALEKDGWSKQAVLVTDRGDPRSLLGSKVDMSGDGSTVLATSRRNPNSEDGGAIYAFETSDDGWTEQARVVPDQTTSALGASLALSSDGSTGVAGARWDNENGRMAGTAYILTKNDDSWTQEVKLTPEDGEAGDEFGSAADVSGDGSTVVVGTQDASRTRTDQEGVAYVFVRESTGWREQAKLMPADNEGGGWFGRATAISNDGASVLVGDPASGDSGAVYAFERSDSSWRQQARVTAEDGDPGDGFGEAIAISNDGDVAVIGDSNDNQGVGSVYVFVQSDGSWTQESKIPVQGEDSDDEFGTAVAVAGAGTAAVLGEPLNDGGSADRLERGSAYIFQ
jgi:hypothetical protein